MTDVLVRDLDPEIVERLKARARRHGRSLQGEAKAILEAAAGLSMAEARLLADEWQGRLAGGQYGDSAAQIREDRSRET